MEQKASSFSDKELKTLANRFKILSEISRLKILRSLFSDELCVSEIMTVTGLMQANVSKQLRILENNGIVKCRPSGLQRFYRVSDEAVLGICRQLCGQKVTNPNVVE